MTDFILFLKNLLECIKGERYDNISDKDLRYIYNNLNLIEKHHVILKFPKEMNPQNVQPQEDNLNHYNQENYPPLIGEVKTIVQMYVHDYMTNNRGGSLLFGVMQFLNTFGIVCYPGAVTRVVMKTQQKIMQKAYNGPRYDDEEIKLLINRVKNQQGIIYD